ncbi:SMI1/KNR4 family protein [Streptomyces sp. TRM66268-LWL]|uniref:SMI1/KNR4 family protein n=1 Tax=Streptomyces polyasparticus TaxID=2767826 RepID=A0ABR7S9U4_9ACTN|nr:SMI1/KNR4 family protein [Streptomyces polyasparticus]MBC9711535.1 SMI1/KNR4 family protein [Streptomyces polyasparticus]
MELTGPAAALATLVGPPPAPAPAVDWAAVEAWLEVPLPADYKAVFSAYGPVEIGDPAGVRVRLLGPCVSSDGRFDYGSWLVETHRHSAIRPRMFTREQREFLPREGGLLVFGETSSGDQLFWDTSVSKDPDEWPVVLLTTRVAAHVDEPWVAYEVPLLELLSAAIRGGVPNPGEPGGLLGPLGREVRVFEPLARAGSWAPPAPGVHADARQHAALTRGEGLEAVLALVPPPLTPYVGEGSWEEVFERIGTRLPADFIQLSERYGAGIWSWWLRLPAPLDPQPNGLAAEVGWMLDGYRRLRSGHPDGMPLPTWPEPGGFLPFTSTIDGDQVGWCTEGDPDEWRVAVYPRHSEPGPPLPGNFTQTLLNWLRGGRGDGEAFRGLPRNRDPLDVMFFQPHTPSPDPS